MFIILGADIDKLNAELQKIGLTLVDNHQIKNYNLIEKYHPLKKLFFYRLPDIKNSNFSKIISNCANQSINK